MFALPLASGAGGAAWQRLRGGFAERQVQVRRRHRRPRELCHVEDFVKRWFTATHTEIVLCQGGFECAGKH